MPASRPSSRVAFSSIIAAAMSPRVRLSDIIDALEMQFEESTSFLNLDTGEVETVSHDLLRQAEEFDGSHLPDLPTWQTGEWEAAKRIICSDRFKELPTKFDVHEWEIMRDFTSTVSSDNMRDELLRAVHGSGAFRRFKETVRRHGLESAWFSFRGNALKQIACDWCEENGIACE